MSQKDEVKYMEIHQRLKELREDSDLTQKQVAEYLKTSFQYYNKLENGKHEMTISRLKALCELYQVSADYILGLPKGLSWPREPKN